MAEPTSSFGSRPSRQRASKATAVFAMIAAVVYWILFTPGWGFLLAAGIVVGILYFILPSVSAALR